VVRRRHACWSHRQHLHHFCVLETRGSTTQRLGTPRSPRDHNLLGSFLVDYQYVRGWPGLNLYKSGLQEIHFIFIWSLHLWAIEVMIWELISHFVVVASHRSCLSWYLEPKGASRSLALVLTKTNHAFSIMSVHFIYRFKITYRIPTAQCGQRHELSIGGVYERDYRLGLRGGDESPSHPFRVKPKIKVDG